MAPKGRTIDILLNNNAGVYLGKGVPTLGSFRYDDWTSTQPLVVVAGSHTGSIVGIAAPGTRYYYRSGKAALNGSFRGLAEELRPRGMPVVLLHPGAVRMRMGGPRKYSDDPAKCCGDAKSD